MSPDAPTARWARGVEGWREARQVLASPWGTLHPQEERRCQVGGTGSQMVGLEEEVVRLTTAVVYEDLLLSPKVL